MSNHDKEIIEYGLTHPDYMVRIETLLRPDFHPTNEQAARGFADEHEDVVMEWIHKAGDLATRADIIEGIKHPDPEVRSAWITHPAITLDEEMVDILMEDEHEGVRLDLARDGKFTPTEDQLSRGMNDPDADVSEAWKERFSSMMAGANQRKVAPIGLTAHDKRQPLLLIGLHGGAGCGKDTLANHWEGTRGARTIRLADPIIDALVAMFSAMGLTRRHFDDRGLKDSVFEPLGMTPRALANSLGRKWLAHEFNDRALIDIAQAKIDKLASFGARMIVVTDVRMPAEAEWLREQGGRILQIERPQNPFEKEEHRKYETEKKLPPHLVDHTLLNDREGNPYAYLSSADELLAHYESLGCPSPERNDQRVKHSFKR